MVARLTLKELARRFKRKVRTLRAWKDRGAPIKKVRGRLVGYFDKVDKWRERTRADIPGPKGKRRSCSKVAPRLLVNKTAIQEQKG